MFKGVIGLRNRRRFGWWFFLLLVMIAVGVGAVWFGPRFFSVKAGALLLKPTDDSFDAAAKQAVLQVTGKLNARVVWSSSRTGNHEIYLMTLPDLVTYRLTSNDRVDYFPRFSPDGSQIVFARSQRPWVSEREASLWDIFLLSLADGTERQLAKDANSPQWVDKKHVSFVRHGREVVVLDLENGREQQVYPVAGQAVSWKTISNPEFSPRDRRKLAVTGRGGVSGDGVFLFDLAKNVSQRFGTGGTCEITWGSDASSLLWMQNGGRGGTRIMSSPLLPEKKDVFLDLPGEFSHEYFPRLSRDGRWLVLGASTGGHEHDLADYEIFLWQIGHPWEQVVRLTVNPANDRWPDIFVISQ